MQRVLQGLVLAGLVLLALPGRAVDWSRYSADEVEEPGGGAAAFTVGIDPALYSLGYDFGVRLKAFPALGSTLGTFMLYDADVQTLFAAPLFMLRLVPPRWRLAPYLGAGASYAFSVAGETEEPGDERGTSHAALHAEAGLRWRLRDGGYIDLGAALRHPFIDLPDDEPRQQLAVRLAFGAEP